MREPRGAEEHVLSEAKGRGYFKQVGMQKARLKVFLLILKVVRRKMGRERR